MSSRGSMEFLQRVEGLLFKPELLPSSCQEGKYLSGDGYDHDFIL